MARHADGRTGEAGWANQRHFVAAAAEAMRRILVENARRKRREKHGGGRQREHADLDALSAEGLQQNILALHAALDQFALKEPLKAKLVELRFFGGLTLEQAASSLRSHPRPPIVPGGTAAPGCMRRWLIASPRKRRQPDLIRGAASYEVAKTAIERREGKATIAPLENVTLAMPPGD